MKTLTRILTVAVLIVVFSVSVCAAALPQSAELMPETGGIGTTIFYTVGGVLMVGAVILLVTKKRMNNK